MLKLGKQHAHALGRFFATADVDRFSASGVQKYHLAVGAKPFAAISFPMAFQMAVMSDNLLLVKDLRLNSRESTSRFSAQIRDFSMWPGYLSGWSFLPETF